MEITTPAETPSWRLPLLLVLLALLVRGYQLATPPLWLDEIYGFQLAQRGPETILQNMFAEEHPPLFYLLQWLASGFGQLSHELAWRWLSAGAGALTIGLVFLSGRAVASTSGAVLSCGLLLLSPMHIYFSQEARPTALLVLWAALSTTLLIRLLGTPQRPALWWGWVLVSAAGLYTGYPYLLILVVQLPYMLLLERHRAQTLRYGTLLALLCLPLLIGLATVSSKLETYGNTPAASLLAVLQALSGGDPVRYGWGWQHSWLLGVLMSLAAVGAWRGLQKPHHRLTRYLMAQLVVPPLLFFGLLVPLFALTMPLMQAKHFMVLFPALFVLIAQGIHVLLKRSARWRWPLFGFGGAYAGALLACLVSLQVYWATPRSPEGSLVRSILPAMQSDDVVVSLHYSVDAALSFYSPELQPYTKPRPPHTDSDVAGYQFTRSVSVLQHDWHTLTYTTDLVAIPREPRLWLFGLQSETALTDTLSAGCTIAAEQASPPFQVRLLTDCPPAKTSTTPTAQE